MLYPVPMTGFPKAEPVHEPPPAAAKNMLELLCTVAGEEERRSPPRNGQPVSHPPPTMLLATPASPESEQRPSANDLLAKAMAGVGAAGSLARIRQQLGERQSAEHPPQLGFDCRAAPGQGGLADRLTGMMTALLLAILSGRAFQLAWPGVESAYATMMAGVRILPRRPSLCCATNHAARTKRLPTQNPSCFSPSCCGALFIFLDANAF